MEAAMISRVIKTPTTAAGIALVVIASFTATAFASHCHDSADPQTNVTDNAQPAEVRQGESSAADFR
jgi:hypothetical protein